MKGKLLLAAVCIVLLPVFWSPSAGDGQINSAPFATVAIAGHVTPGGNFCVCDGSVPNCICDEGEQPPASGGSHAASHAGKAASDNQPGNSSDPGAVVMLLALALLLGLRLRF